MKSSGYLFFLSQTVAIVNCLIGCLVNALTVVSQINAPYTLVMSFYALLLFSFAFKDARTRIGILKTMLIAVFCVLDLGATSLINTAYEFTGVSSVILITSLTTPFSAVFCWLFVRAKLVPEQLLTMVAALFATGAFVILDWAGGSSIKGGLLALGGAIGYGINTAYNEFLLRRGLTALQILSRLGLFGTGLALCLSMSLELDTLKTASWTAGLFIPGYALAMVGFYALQMHAIQKKGAVFLNMAVLCTNLYSMITGPLLFGTHVSPVQIIVAIVLVVAVGIFNLL